jgi:prolyl-tRNA synthetase
MAHGDNRGLKLPPRVAPVQAVIVPIAQHKDGVLDKANELFQELNKDYRMKLDDRDNYSTGFKFNDWEMRGVPVRIEIGPRDIENGVAVLVRRDSGEKEVVELNNLDKRLGELLEDIQKNMFEICLNRKNNKTTVAYTLEEILKNLEENQGYVKTMWCGDVTCEEKIKEVTGAHSRCIPFEQENISDTCVCCGKKADKMVYWGKAY